MKFGEVPVEDAFGAVLAHSVKHTAGMFKKGRLVSAADITLLKASGVAKVFAARFETGDVPEDEAAMLIAQAISGPGAPAQEPFTGRANLHAETAGVALIDEERVRQLNRLHESLTLATVAKFDVVEARQLVATVKVIPFAVPRDVVDKARAIIGNAPLVQVASFKAKRAGLVITKLPQTKPSLIEKSETAMRERLEALGGTLGDVIVCDHSIAAVRDAVANLRRGSHDPVLVFGASAIVDRGDVIPAAVVAAGGEVVHLGMPVDPGNLMMLGQVSHVPVIGVPSCARSPKLNGFDWVLARLMAGIECLRHRHHGHGCRRSPQGNPDSALAARRAEPGADGGTDRGDPACCRAVASHGFQQAACRCWRDCHGAALSRGGAGGAGRPGHRGDGARA